MPKHSPQTSKVETRPAAYTLSRKSKETPRASMGAMIMSCEMGAERKSAGEGRWNVVQGGPVQDGGSVDSKVAVELGGEKRMDGMAGTREDREITEGKEA